MAKARKQKLINVTPTSRSTTTGSADSDDLLASGNIEDALTTQVSGDEPSAVDIVDLTALMAQLLQARDRSRSARAQVCKSNSVIWDSGLRDDYSESRQKQSVQDLVEAQMAYNKARAAFASALAEFQNANKNAERGHGGEIRSFVPAERMALAG